MLGVTWLVNADFFTFFFRTGLSAGMLYPTVVRVRVSVYQAVLKTPEAPACHRLPNEVNQN